LKEIQLSQLDPNFKFEVANRLGGESLKACFACGTCTGACPVKAVNDAFDPLNIIRQILLGMKKQVLSSEIIWHCILCNTCSFVCPQDVKFSQVIPVLREMAIENGYVPPSFKETVTKIDRCMLEQREKMLSDAFNKLKEDEESER